MAERKKLVVVTRVKYWLNTGGIYQRSANLIRYLSKNLDVTVFYVGNAAPGDHESASQFSADFSLVWNNRETTYSDEVYKEDFSRFCKTKDFDACLIIRIDCAIFKDALPKNTTTFLEIDDLASEQDQGKRDIGMEALWGITFEEELDIFRKFDALIVIHQEHKVRLSNYFSKDNIIVAGHSVSFKKIPIRDSVKNIGFIGSYWEANMDAMYWFMYEVWPHYSDTDLHMHIYGEVARGLHQFPYENVTVHSYVENIIDIYESCDIFVNPVRYGSGLKIKAVETMANGLPLIASNEGVRGLTHMKDSAFLLANTKREFLRHINRLISSKEDRVALGNAAYEYASSTFTDDDSYSALIKKISQAGDSTVLDAPIKISTSTQD